MHGHGSRCQSYGLNLEHFQQKCEAVLRGIMRKINRAFPAKVRELFAWDNAETK